MRRTSLCTAVLVLAAATGAFGQDVTKYVRYEHQGAMWGEQPSTVL